MNISEHKIGLQLKKDIKNLVLYNIFKILILITYLKIIEIDYDKKLLDNQNFVIFLHYIFLHFFRYSLLDILTL